MCERKVSDLMYDPNSMTPNLTFIATQVTMEMLNCYLDNIPTLIAFPIFFCCFHPYARLVLTQVLETGGHLVMTNTFVNYNLNFFIAF